MPNRWAFVVVEGVVVVVVVSSEARMLAHLTVRMRSLRLRNMRVGFSKVRSETVMRAVPPLLLAQNAYRTFGEDGKVVSCERASR